jgi:hypothetical protein
MSTPTYVYGLMTAGIELPEDLKGLGPTGRVTTIQHGKLAAIVGDVPVDRPLGTREDLIAHESVLDSLAAKTAVLPMRFPAVVEENGVVDELLAPNQDYFVELLGNLRGRKQFTLKGRYVEDVVLREVLERDEEIRSLQRRVQELPEDAAYYDRLQLGEMIVNALGALRDVDAAALLEPLQPLAVDTVTRQPANPEDVLNAAFLLSDKRIDEFEEAVEELGRAHAGRIRLRLLGPLAPYDFVPEE